MRVPRWALVLLGYTIPLGLVALGATLWGNHIEHRIDRVVVERHRDDRKLNRLTAAVGGGDALQPASHAGQPAGPAHGPAHPAPHGSHPNGGIQHPAGTPEPSANEPPGPPAGNPANGEAPVTHPGPPESTPSPAAPGKGSGESGLVGNPGGVLGKAICSVNQLGIAVCTE